MDDDSLYVVLKVHIYMDGNERESLRDECLSEVLFALPKQKAETGKHFYFCRNHELTILQK